MPPGTGMEGYRGGGLFSLAGNVPCALLGLGLHRSSRAGAFPEQHGLGKGFRWLPRERYLLGVAVLLEKAGAGDAPFATALLCAVLQAPVAPNAGALPRSPAGPQPLGAGVGAVSPRCEWGVLVVSGEPGGGEQSLEARASVLCSPGTLSHWVWEHPQLWGWRWGPWAQPGCRCARAFPRCCGEGEPLPGVSGSATAVLPPQEAALAQFPELAPAQPELCLPGDQPPVLCPAQPAPEVLPAAAHGHHGEVLRAPQASLDLVSWWGGERGWCPPWGPAAGGSSPVRRWRRGGEEAGAELALLCPAVGVLASVGWGPTLGFWHWLRPGGAAGICGALKMLQQRKRAGSGFLL